MNFEVKSHLSKTEKEEVFELWNKEFPDNLRKERLEDLQKFFDDVQDHQFIISRDESQRMNGWFFIFLREAEIWFSIIVDSQHHGKNIGSQLMNKAKELRDQLNGWVVDHQNDKKADGSPYPSPIKFYLKNEFEVLNDRLEKGDISAVKIRWTRPK